MSANPTMSDRVQTRWLHNTKLPFLLLAALARMWRLPSI